MRYFKYDIYIFMTPEAYFFKFDTINLGTVRESTVRESNDREVKQINIIIILPGPFK